MNLSVISLCVAGLSLGASGYQAYLNSRNLEAVQRDIGRREIIRGCKEVIEAYFDVKLKISRLGITLAAAPSRESEMFAASDALGAVNRFGAIGTYLANFLGEDARAAYTELARELEGLARSVQSVPGEPPPTLFARADGVFARMNADCARASSRFLD
jgi:hypothetical protein